MPATRQDLFDRFARLGIRTRTVEHPPLFTVEQSQALRGEIPGAHTKNLFLKDRKGGCFLIGVEETAVLDLKTIHQRIGASGRVSFGSAERLMELLGVAPGAVTLFGVLNDTEGRVKVVIDAGLAAHATINAHPLVNTATTSIGREDLIRFLRDTGHEPAILNLAA